MALAPARQAGGRAARIADFWRISAVFDPISGGPGQRFPADETRADFPGAGIPASDRRPLPGRFKQRGAVLGSRPAMPRPVCLGRAARGAVRHVSLV